MALHHQRGAHNEHLHLRRILRILGLTLYWSLLVLFVGFFFILHGWDSLPEPYDQRFFLFVILLVVLGLLIATWRKPLLHFSVVAVFLLLGALFYAQAQGVVESPDMTDREILVRTTELLADEARWDRSLESDCELGSATLTLYCALHQASYDVYGGFRHRRPALQVVRVEIEEYRPDADYPHRLGGFNADPEVSHQDLLALLQASIDEIDSRLK